MVEVVRPFHGDSASDTFAGSETYGREHSLLPLHCATPPMTAAQIGSRVFAGEILLFSPSAASQLLQRRVRNIVRECFDMQNPIHAHVEYSRQSFLRRAEQAQRRVNSEECKPLFAGLLEGAGMTTKNIFWDTLGLRVAPPVASPQDIKKRGFRSYVGVHRDTWGAGFQAQVNWWSPVWDITRQRTMAFYPSYFRRPLENSTAQWSFKEYLASRKQTKGGSAAVYPSAPGALAEPDASPVPLVIRAGEWACFSSAHLHRSIANATSLTRFSLEIRTLNLRDLQTNRGAPNADNKSQSLLYGLYSSISGGIPLKEVAPQRK